MISLCKHFLFIHIPKTGGNSIQSVLKVHSEDEIVADKPWQDGVERFEVVNRRHSLWKHATGAQYRDALGEAIYNSLWKFAVIRNPWDMMISMYFSPHRGVKEWSPDAFLRLLGETKTYVEYLRLEDGGDAAVDSLIRYEHIQEGFDEVCRKLALPVASLPRFNCSARNHYHHYYNKELRRLVAEKFSWEIEHWGYRYESS